MAPHWFSTTDRKSYSRTTWIAVTWISSQNEVAISQYYATFTLSLIINQATTPTRDTILKLSQSINTQKANGNCNNGGQRKFRTTRDSVSRSQNRDDSVKNFEKTTTSKLGTWKLVGCVIYSILGITVYNVSRKSFSLPFVFWFMPGAWSVGVGLKWHTMSATEDSRFLLRFISKSMRMPIRLSKAPLFPI